MCDEKKWAWCRLRITSRLWSRVINSSNKYFVANYSSVVTTSSTRSLYGRQKALRKFPKIFQKPIHGQDWVPRESTCSRWNTVHRRRTQNSSRVRGGNIYCMAPLRFRVGWGLKRLKKRSVQHSPALPPLTGVIKRWAAYMCGQITWINVCWSHPSLES